jgi:hypothetical protein
MRGLHARFPILIEEGPPEKSSWGVSFQRMFDMANDSGLFRSADELEVEGWSRRGEVFTRDGQRCLPLLEGKMTWLWNPRYGTYDGQTQAQANKGVLPPSSDRDLADPSYVNRPRYWVDGWRVDEAWKGDREWSFAWRDVGPSERTLIVSAVPKWAAGDKLPLMHCPSERTTPHLCLLAVLSSFVVDYSIRARTATGSMKYFLLKQVPILSPDDFDGVAPWDSGTDLSEWIGLRALELIFTTNALKPLAVVSGYKGPPFRWEPDRRFLLSAELDAAMFHIFGVERADADYIMDSFRLVRDSDEKAHGEYRTKRVILEIYDEMAAAAERGEDYRTHLDPPPADPRAATRLGTPPQQRGSPTGVGRAR